jgi:hypothetical protein
MDYFNELLESYARLKKRTFKLTFINEAEDKNSEQSKMDDKMRKDAEAQALAIAQAGVTQFFDKDKNIANVLYAFRKSGGVDEAGNKIPIGNVKGANGPFGTGTPEIADAGGNPLVDSEGWKKLVNYFLQGDAATDEVQKTNEKELEDLLAKAEEKIGGAFWNNLADQLLKDGTATTKNEALQMAEEMVKANPELIGGKSVIDSYKKQIKHAYFYIKELMIKYPDGVPEDLQAFVNNPVIYIAGAAGQSLERYLADGTSFTLDENGKQIITDLGPGAIQEAVLANEFLLSFLNPAEDYEGKCADVRKKIGVQRTGGRNQIILFGSERDGNGVPIEGVSVNSNKLQEKAIKAVSEKCPEEAGNLSVVIDGKINASNKNAIKGSIYEVIPRVAVLFNKLTQNPTNQKIKDSLKRLIEKTLIEEKIPILELLAEESGALSIETFIEQQEAIEQLGIISSKQKLGAWLLTEAKLMNLFIKLIPHEPDDVLHVALSPKTGDRADNSFMYSSKEEAEASAKAIGASVVTMSKSQILDQVPQKKRAEVKKQLDELYKDDQPIHIVSIGQKRMVEHVATKLGELNRQITMRNYMNKRDPKGNVADGFFDVLDSLVPLSKSDSDYYNSVESFVEAAVAPFREAKIYSSNGMLKIQKPEHIAKAVSKSLAGKFTQQQIKDLNLTQLFFDGDNLRDFSDPIVQQRIAEGLERNIRMMTYKKDLRDSATRKKAEAVLLRQALICGYNVNDITQVKGTNDGRTIAWSHNEPMRQAVSKWKEGNLNISIDGNTASFTSTDDDPMTYITFSQEGTYSGKGEKRKRETRSQTKVTEEAMDRFDILNKSKN